ncbi:MAG: VOC family protein [Streptococcus salivarius]
MNYYVSVFPNSKIKNIEYYPDEKLDEHFVGMSGKVLNGEFSLNGLTLSALMAVQFSNLMKQLVLLQLVKIKPKLMIIGQNFHVKEAEQCGWCKDKFVFLGNYSENLDVNGKRR